MFKNKCAFPARTEYLNPMLTYLTWYGIVKGEKETLDLETLDRKQINKQVRHDFIGILFSSCSIHIFAEHSRKINQRCAFDIEL